MREVTFMLGPLGSVGFTARAVTRSVATVTLMISRRDQQASEPAFVRAAFSPSGASFGATPPISECRVTRRSKIRLAMGLGGRRRGFNGVDRPLG